MHEASIALSLVSLIEETVRVEGAKRALSAEVEIGALSHVDAQALMVSFGSAAQGTVADGARLDLIRPPGEAACMGCGAKVAIGARGDPCPACGSHRLLVTDGDQLRLRSVEVA